MPLTVILRLVLGPLLVALLPGVELSRYGVLTAAISAYLGFVAEQAGVGVSGRYRLRVAERRLAAQRRRRTRFRSVGLAYHREHGRRVGDQ
jgi:hypothetical protein